MEGINYFLYCVMGFILGGTLFSYHLPLIFKNVNVVTASHDHNPGTANAFKHAGFFVGVLCLLCDLLKGFLPIYLARQTLDINHFAFSFVLAAPVLGHALAPFYKFKGGKAIATAFGVLLGLLPQCYLVFILAFWYIFYSIILKVNPHEKRTVITFFCFSISSVMYCVYYKFAPLLAGCIIIATIAIWRNIDLESFFTKRNKANGFNNERLNRK